MKFDRRVQSIEVSVERSETFTIRRQRSISIRWCGDCEIEVRMADPESAARLFGLSIRSVYLAVETRGVHFIESADGALLVCLRSMADVPASQKFSEEKQVNHE